MAFMRRFMEMPWLSNSNSGVFLSKEKSTCLLTIKVWHYNVDFLCYDSIIVELKALDNLVAANTGQVLNYLKVANLSYALLYNFGEPAIKIKRIKL